ncbi:hypothetical protein EDD85DRAFT_791030 [Armillaria nabsnona]|nr:hypothetical protein EDD85DRAFT_791030 [Armillaria nabsnona]
MALQSEAILRLCYPAREGDRHDENRLWNQTFRDIEFLILGQENFVALLRGLSRANRDTPVNPRVCYNAITYCDTSCRGGVSCAQKECKAENLSIPSQSCDSDVTPMDAKGIAANQYYYYSCLRVDAADTALRGSELGHWGAAIYVGSYSRASNQIVVFGVKEDLDIGVQSSDLPIVPQGSDLEMPFKSEKLTSMPDIFNEHRQCHLRPIKALGEVLRFDSGAKPQQLRKPRRMLHYKYPEDEDADTEREVGDIGVGTDMNQEWRGNIVGGSTILVPPLYIYDSGH